MKFKQYINETQEFKVKSITGKSSLKTNISPEKRTLNNLPRDSKKKPKCKFQDWLGLKGNCSKGYDEKYYGWTHRGISGFGVGDNISSDSIAHKDYKYNYKTDTDNRKDLKSYIIKTDKEAKEHAVKFVKELS